jgi:hypothetical protein
MYNNSNYYALYRELSNVIGLYVLILSFFDTTYLTGCKDITSLHYNL